MDAPALDCSLCPRLAAFRQANAIAFPDWHNAPVASFGGSDAALLIVGLAPGLRGANRTGRPFTGDWAGQLLYPTLLKFGLATGPYDERPDDGLQLINARITNAVRCVPPQNKPTGDEARACRPFLVSEIGGMARLKGILALGKVAHDAVLTTLGEKRSAFKFSHGALHFLGNELWLTDSYHCSRYNTNTRRLTTEMFEDVVSAAARRIKD
ncbi:MAG: uracil-DNA glycosylase [Alphaproteobacteria bacterium]|nr:uracil-DNA glycosylase [Alphaproteobacteria bacterium]